jgi:membrane-associated PAP2 superfamily phosphatase
MDSPAELYPHRDRLFWRNHALWPFVAFALTFALIETLGLDRRIAEAWSFDAASGRWLGSGAGDWWAHRLLHDDGRWLVRGIAALAIVAWAGSFVLDAWRGWRRRAGYVALGMVLAVAVVGGLKAVTNVDCPWDLAGFGGQNPYIPLFADRPGYLPAARCFPGAHSASGFALMCLYFAWRDSSPVLARWGLWAGLALGVAFAVGQEARGAHFLSHDLTSVGLVWFVQLALYGWLLRPGSQASGATGSHRPLAVRSESGL